ncbi:MAG: hypothetical protein K5656_08880 [Lachnospiraceae bacterium]|nr:hypothetical protein [Lachnospiraceae bacterium]
MEIKNRLFPYPVLCEDTDDYIEGEFRVEPEVISQNMSHTLVSFRISLDNPGLKSLIKQGYAEYVIHIECSNTSFRTVLHTFSDEESYYLNNGKVNGDVALVGMIVAKKEIANYQNDRLNDDYDDVNLTIPRAAIMAYCNMPRLNILKNYEELSQEESLFSVIGNIKKDQNEELPVRFSLDSDRIKIFVDAEVRDAYIAYQNNVAMRPLIWSVLLIPALTFMMEELRRDYEAYENCRWFIKFSAFYRQQGKDFVEDVIYGENPITDIVQELLQLPIGKTFLNMQEMIGD